MPSTRAPTIMIVDVSSPSSSKSPSSASTSSTFSSFSSSRSLSPRFPSHASRPAFFGPGSSPPPSPALPSLIPRHGKVKKPFKKRRKQYRNIIIIFGACVVLTWLALTASSSNSAASPTWRTAAPGLSNEHATTPQYELVADDALPAHPSVVVVADNRRYTRWTVSIPPKHAFPLRPAVYKELCEQADDLSAHVAALETSKQRRRKPRAGYYRVDANFLDVADAERQGLLAHAIAAAAASRPEHDDVCEKSLTYVMETDDAGMGATLMGLWMAYGLAKKEGRAFFVDDTRWPYGNYTSFFRPPPEQPCRHPPPSHRLPCPHSAAHLVVSAVTFGRTFGDSFLAAFSTITQRPHLGRQTHVYDLARAGHEALFHLSDDGDVDYLRARKREIAQTRQQGGTTVGLHIRRGDCHPWEFQYRQDYIPALSYINGASQALAAAAAKSTTYDQVVLLASDDPDVYAAPELARCVRAQDRIVLASKRALERAQGADPAAPAPAGIDRVLGWEGGFFRNVFWGLGRGDQARANAGATGPRPPSLDTLLRHVDTRERAECGEAAQGLRAMVGRAYLLDLAVLAEADDVVCAVSAMGCRLLAVMLGPEKVKSGRWRNVELGFRWTGV